MIHLGAILVHSWIPQIPTGFAQKHFLSRTHFQQSFKPTLSTICGPTPFIHIVRLEVSSQKSILEKIVNPLPFSSALCIIERASPQAFCFWPSTNFEAFGLPRPLKSPLSLEISKDTRIQLVSWIGTKWSGERNIWARWDAGRWTAYNCSAGENDAPSPKSLN